MRRPYAVLLTVALAVAGVALPATAAAAVEPPRVRVTPGVTSAVVGTTRQLTATVTNLENTAVVWSVRSGPGSVDAEGLYTPPATPPADPVAVVRATSAEDAALFGEATVTIDSGVAGGGFAPGVTVEGGSYDVEAGDVNADGVADVVRLQIGANSLQLVRIVALVSDGAGGFVTKASAYSYLGSGNNDFFGDVALGDFDGDGDLDAYAAIEAVTSAFNEYTLFRNDGTGAFAPDPVVVAEVNEGRAGARTKAVDFDRDGVLDVVRLDRFGSVTFHKGTGAATFQKAVGLFSTSWGRTLAVGDVSGDGRPDVAVGTRTAAGSPVMTQVDVAVNDGFGGIASRTTYSPGLDPEPVIYDADGDGWNDLLASIGSEGAPSHPARLVVHRNLTSGTGGLATATVQLLAFRPHDLHPAHLDGDGVLDLAGATGLGPVLLRRSGPNTFTQSHATTYYPHHVGVGDFTGDGRVDVYATFDDRSTFFPGSADTTFEFAVDPVVTWINVEQTAAMTATIRNSAAPPTLVWSATRGSFPTTFDRNVYTAPASASPTGTPVRITATLAGTATTATRDIFVVNDEYVFTSLGGQQVRQLVTDPATGHLYAATASGVYRSTNGGATFPQLGATTVTGTDAREVTVVRDDGAGVLAVVARFATGIFRYDVTAGGEWVDADGGAFSAVAVDAASGSAVVFAAGATGSVWRSAAHGAPGTWTELTGTTSVTDVVAIGPDTFWAARSAAPRVAVGTVSGGAATLADHALPEPGAAVHAIAVDPLDRTSALVATAESNGRRLYRGTTTGSWTALPVPVVVNQLAISPDGVLLAADDASQSVFKSRDAGASWYSIYRGFTSGLNVLTVGARSDGLTLVGTASGLYTPLDTTPPAAPEITSGPAGTTGPGGSNAFAFAFTSPETTNLCALDGAAWSSCTDTKTYSGPLSSGSHTFSVVAVDGNGNESAPATWAWTVDATPAPVPSITSGPAALARSTSAAFEFTLSGDATGAVCSLDGGTASSCVSGGTGASYTGLSQGAHTFAVRSVDPYGNQSAPATHTWTADTLPPVYPGFTMTPGWTRPDGNASFAWQTDPDATYTCELDGEPVTCGAGSYSVTGLADGEHTFQVAATDAAGNVAGNAHGWTVDSTPPTAPVLTLTPPLSTTATTARFEYTSDTWAYDCTLDGEPVACWFDGADLTGLAGGSHTFVVRARDDFNRLSDPTSYTWTVVVEDPPGTPDILTGPSGQVRTRTAAFTYSAAEGLTFTCSLDGATPAPCDAAGITYTDLAEGPHTFAVRAVTAGGTPSAPASASWTVDVTAPAAPVLSAKPPLRTGFPSASFGWTAEPGVLYRCLLDGAVVTCGTGAYDATGLADGSHTFSLVARDQAGNDSDPATHTWTVDTTGPVVTLDAKPPALVRATTLSYAVSTDAPDHAAFHCTFDGAPVDCADGTVDASVPADSAPYWFRVYATDDLGNAGPTVAYEVFVDYGTPSGAIHTDGPSLTAPRIVSWDEIVTNVTPTTVRIVVTGTTTAVPVTFACRDHANVVVPCTGSTVREAVLTPSKPLVPGQYYTFRASGVTDRVGNVMEPESASFRASTIEQEGTAGAKATWRKVASSSAQGGSYVLTDLRGASATYVFTGTRLVWYARRGPSFGKADVYVDGVRKRTVSFYSSTNGSTYQVLDGLSNAKHTLKIVVRGERGSTSGTGSYVAVDAFKVGSTTSATPAATYAWAPRAASAASGGRYAVEDNAGATYTVTFRGTAFSWVTVLGSGMGKATVKVDGRAPVTVDNYAAATRYGYVRKFGGLADTVHTVTITVLGQRRSGASAAYVAFDRFGVT